ncbi:MAG: hypothetical protein Q8P39_01655 [Candidatus Yanofskybacteria bacterium]|nr:hypothetical protein [Candidatus Yanofskybacteria bacterium]
MPTIPPLIFTILAYIWEFIIAWWWLFLPFLLIKPALKFLLYWREEVYDNSVARMVLDIRIPSSEILRPFKAMEAVFNGLWQVYDPPAVFREKWIEGQSTPSVSLEIASHEGDIHFYIRFARKDRKVVESAIYAQFPDAELTEVEDYVKTMVPPSIPNKEWDLYMADMAFVKPDVYPLRTYTKFFEPVPGEKEALRVDPMGILLEGLQKMGKGEQLWVQMICTPILKDDKDFISQAKAEVNKLVGRKEAKKPSSLLGGIGHDVANVTSVLATGKELEEKEEEKGEEFIPVEMKLTPGERDIVMAIDEKISKHMFRCYLRYAYIAKREVFFTPSKAIPLGYFNQFSTGNLNALKLHGKTKTKMKTIFWFLDKRRVFAKKRHMFRAYVNRMPPFYPKGDGAILLNSEELASLYHFPGKTVAPGAVLERVSAKKGEAPPELPME